MGDEDREVETLWRTFIAMINKVCGLSWRQWGASEKFKAGEAQDSAWKEATL